MTWHVIYVRSKDAQKQLAQISACTYTTKEISLRLSSQRNKCSFSFNEHSDLYFLLHKNSVHIVLLNLKEN